MSYQMCFLSNTCTGRTFWSISDNLLLMGCVWNTRRQGVILQTIVFASEGRNTVSPTTLETGDQKDGLKGHFSGDSDAEQRPPIRGPPWTRYDPHHLAQEQFHAEITETVETVCSLGDV